MAAKLTKCKTCGAEIATSAKVCPSCGAKNKKPVYKRFWFWLLMIILAIFIFDSIGDSFSKKDDPSPTYTVDVNTQQSKEPEESTEPEESEEPEASVEPVEPENLVDGMRPEFKEAMDSYVEFFETYCEILDQYSKNPSDLSILSKYSKYMAQYSEVMEKIDEIDDGTLNEAEMAYYLDATAKITKMASSALF